MLVTGARLLEASNAQGLEGIIAKRLDCPYTPGRRSNGWVKVKNIRRTDAVIGGWLPGEGGRSGRLGALLEPLARDTSPFSGRQPPKLTRFVEPSLVCVVDYSEVTNAGTLRQPSYKGLRDDLDATQVGPPE